MRTVKTFSFPLGHIHSQYSLGYGVHNWQEYCHYHSHPLGFCDWQSADMFYEHDLTGETNIFLGQEFYFYLPSCSGKFAFSFYPKDALGAAFLLLFSGWYHFQLKRKHKNLFLLKQLAPWMRRLHVFYNPKQETSEAFEFCLSYIRTLPFEIYVTWYMPQALNKTLSFQKCSCRLMFMKHVFMLPHTPPAIFFLKYAYYKNISFAKAALHQRFGNIIPGRQVERSSVSLPHNYTPATKYLPEFQKRSMQSILADKCSRREKMMIYGYQYSFFQNSDYKVLRKIYPLSSREFEQYFLGRIKNRRIIFLAEKIIPLPDFFRHTSQRELILPAAYPNLCMTIN